MNPFGQIIKDEGPIAVNTPQKQAPSPPPDSLTTPKKYLLIRPPLEEVMPPLPAVTNKVLYKYIVFEKTVESSLPYGLMKIGAYLRHHGHHVRLLDFGPHTDDSQKVPLHLFEFRTPGLSGTSTKKYPVYLIGNSLPEIEATLGKEDAPDEIFITNSMTFHAKITERLITLCKTRFPNAKITVGGTLATLCPDFVRSAGAHESFKGTFKEAEEFDSDLTLLDYVPDYHIFKSTRGCPMSCSYCAVHILEGRKMSFRSWESTVKEIVTVNKTYGIDVFRAWESNLLVNSKNHFEKMLDGIIESGIHIELEAPEGIAPQLLTLDLAKKMLQSGFLNVDVPLESASDQINLQRFRRVVTLAQFDRCIQHLLDAGFKNRDIWIFCLVGMPNQTLDEQAASFWKVWSMHIRPLAMFFTPIPTTKEYEDWKHTITHKSLGDLHPYLFPFADKDFTIEDMEDFLTIQFSLHPLERLHYLSQSSRLKTNLLGRLNEDQAMRKFTYQMALYPLLLEEEYHRISTMIPTSEKGDLFIHWFIEGFEKFQNDYQTESSIEEQTHHHSAFQEAAHSLRNRGATITDTIPISGTYNRIHLDFPLLYQTESEIRETILQTNNLLAPGGTISIRVWSPLAPQLAPSLFPTATSMAPSFPHIKTIQQWQTFFDELGLESTIENDQKLFLRISLCAIGATTLAPVIPATN